MSRALALLLAALWLAGCKDGKDAENTAPPKRHEQSDSDESRNGPMSWERAEAIAREHHLSQGATKFPFERHPRVKYLFTFSHARLLVHGGEVIKGGGVPALEDYLGALSIEDRKLLLAEDLNVLVRHFDAFPPIEQGEGDRLGYYDDSTASGSGGEQPPLRPRIDWSGEEGSYRVYYYVRGQNADKTEDPDLRDVAEWTLSIAADGELAWSERRVRYHFGRKAFVE